MVTRDLRQILVVWGLFVLAACASPLAPDGDSVTDSINRTIEETLRSAQGPWTGVVAGGSIWLEFSLTQAADGRLQGTGSMREAGAGNVPISVSGTYNRPTLSLTFAGMVIGGREVSGTFAEAYTSSSGVFGPLRLTAENYSGSLPLLLQEGTAAPPSLGGRLTDAATGAPVAGATVTVQGTSVSSSSTGHYGFNPNLMAGRFPVTVSHPLYHQAVRDVEIGPYRIEDFKLQPK